MNESPETRTRRQFLARTASAGGLAGAAATGSLSGCLGRQGGGAGSGDNSGTADASTSTPAGLRLETLSVGGSPGDRMAVRPAGEPALLDFFATWCAPCKPQMEELRTVRAENSEFHMLSVSRENDRETIESFWREYEGTWPVAQDSRLEAFQRYGVKRIPTLLVLDAGGSEVWRHSGLAAAEDILEQVSGARS
jgi:Thiol-disulfide isomerase and thioredoxins